MIPHVFTSLGEMERTYTSDRNFADADEMLYLPAIMSSLDV